MLRRDRIRNTLRPSSTGTTWTRRWLRYMLLPEILFGPAVRGLLDPALVRSWPAVFKRRIPRTSIEIEADSRTAAAFLEEPLSILMLYSAPVNMHDGDTTTRAPPKHNSPVPPKRSGLLRITWTTAPKGSASGDSRGTCLQVIRPHFAEFCHLARRFGVSALTNLKFSVRSGNTRL